MLQFDQTRLQKFFFFYQLAHLFNFFLHPRIQPSSQKRRLGTSQIKWPKIYVKKVEAELNKSFSSIAEIVEKKKTFSNAERNIMNAIGCS